MPRHNAREDADRIIAHMERASAALDHASRATTKSNRASKAAQYLDGEVQHGQEPTRVSRSDKTVSEDKSRAYQASQYLNQASSRGRQGEDQKAGKVEKAISYTAYGMMAADAIKGVNRVGNVTELASTGVEKAVGSKTETGKAAGYVGGTAAVLGGIASGGSLLAVAGALLAIPKMISYTVEQGKKTLGEFGKAGSSINSAYKAERGEEIAKGLAHGTQHLLSGAGGVAGGAAGMAVAGPLGAPIGSALGRGAAKALGTVLLPADAILNATEKLRDWSKHLQNANMQFAEFSGTMAGVQARMEVREMMLSKERGDRRADSAEYLAEAQNTLDKRLAPLEDAGAKLKNFATGGLTNIAGYLAKPLEYIGDKLNDGLDKVAEKLGIDVNTEGNDANHDLFEAMRAHGRPKRFKTDL